MVSYFLGWRDNHYFLFLRFLFVCHEFLTSFSFLIFLENCNPEWMKQRASSSVLITPNNNTDSDISPPSFINKVHGSGYSSSEEELNNFASKWDEENPDDLPPSPPATLFPSPSPSSHPSSPFPSPATSLPTQEAVCLYCRPIVDFFSAVFEYFSQFFMCIPNMRQKGRYYFFRFVVRFKLNYLLFIYFLFIIYLFFLSYTSHQ